MSIQDKVQQVSQNNCAGRLMAHAKGPGEFFAHNTCAYVLSLVGASAAVSLFTARAATARGLKRLGWALLAALEAAIFIGIVVVTEEAKREASR